ncbi:hypothetical protein UVI_02041430 [Ustilaginoidea virens]|uniref:Uncharacterized protein n=1 Tax=Ustilaginoidea virens TaxID=1159556 RepID=A0A1B5KWD5_USTVR|nr:hypothetical protein UVI_02041430 [Ustilaginoidea virens]
MTRGAAAGDMDACGVALGTHWRGQFRGAWPIEAYAPSESPRGLQRHLSGAVLCCAVLFQFPIPAGCGPWQPGSRLSGRIPASIRSTVLRSSEPNGLS